jgi:hypothetical protein
VDETRLHLQVHQTSVLQRDVKCSVSHGAAADEPVGNKCGGVVVGGGNEKVMCGG